MLIDIYLVVLILFCIICFIILFILGKRKINTYETIKYNDDVPDMSNGKPVVYELIYISNDPSTGLWQFSKNQDIKNDIDIAIKHFRNNKIKYFLINNNLYKIDKVVSNSLNSFEIKLSNPCQNNSSFLKTCSNVSLSTSLTNATFHVLHVLGYNF